MPEDQARYHMKRCVDSGLWKPATDDPGTNPEDGFRQRPVSADSTEEDQTEESNET